MIVEGRVKKTLSEITLKNGHLPHMVWRLHPSPHQPLWQHNVCAQKASDFETRNNFDPRKLQQLRRPSRSCRVNPSQVIETGCWNNHAWTVKVDPEAVLIPDRLRQHLAGNDLENVYVVNCNKFPSSPNFPMMYVLWRYTPGRRSRRMPMTCSSAWMTWDP